MSRTLGTRRVGKRVTSAQKTPITMASRQERQLELKTRLRIEEADARWHRRKEMLLVGSLAYVALGSFTVWAGIWLSGSYTSTDKQLLTGFIAQLLMNLFLSVAGKKSRGKR